MITASIQMGCRYLSWIKQSAPAVAVDLKTVLPHLLNSMQTWLLILLPTVLPAAPALAQKFTVDWDGNDEPFYTRGDQGKQIPLSEVNSILASASIPLQVGSFANGWHMQDCCSGNHFLGGPTSATGADFYANFLATNGVSRIKVQVGFYPNGVTGTLTAYAEPISNAANASLAALTQVAQQTLQIEPPGFLNFDLRDIPGARSFAIDVQTNSGPAINLIEFTVVVPTRTNPCPAQATIQPTDRGEWWQFRGDRRLTGRSTLKGRIQTPQTRWKYFLGARETYLSLVLQANGTNTVQLPTSDLNTSQLDSLSQDWGIGNPYFNLDASGLLQRIPLSTRYKIGDFLPSQPGHEKVEFESLFDLTTLADRGDLNFGHLYVRQEGQWVSHWASPPVTNLFLANAIVGDFDRDSQLEVAFVPWYDLWVLNLSNGQLKHKAPFKPAGALGGRAYGWLGAFDLGGDNRQEFVIIGDFLNHIDVLGWQNNQLVKLWDHLIEAGIDRKQTIVRPGVDPVQDIDGDGRPEVVISLLNALGDNQWHVVAYDGMTGQIKLDLPNQYLTGLRDLDGDGGAELFCTATIGSLVPEPGSLAIYSFVNRSLIERWRLAQSGFQTYDVSDFPLNVNSVATQPRRTVLVGPVETGGKPLFFSRRQLASTDAETEIVAWQASTNGSIARVGSLTGPGLVALATRSVARDQARLLVRCESPVDVTAGKLTLTGLTGTALLSRQVSEPLSSPVVGRISTSAPPAVIVQGLGETVTALALSGSSESAELLWRKPGRGIYTGADQHTGQPGFGGVLFADLLGNGSPATVVGDRGPDGQASLVALDARGGEIWRHSFDRFPGAPPEWNSGGLTTWMAGHFNDAQREDVLVSLRRGSQHSDELFLLDGRTGKELWNRTEGAFTRGAGGSWMAMFRFDCNGLDEALNFYPDVLYVLDGKDGSFEITRNFGNDIFPSYHLNYGLPIVADFMGRGVMQIYYGNNRDMIGLLDLDGNPIWQQYSENSMPTILPGIGDVDGDGHLAILSPGHARADGQAGSEFHCYDSATGKLKWRLLLNGGSPLTPAVADLDGDGREEAVVAIDNRLMAIGAGTNATSGSIRWTISFPRKIGPPAIAALNGELQILVTCEDGYIHGLGSPNGLFPPLLTLQPRTQIVTADQAVTFAAFAVGTGPLGYQWLHNGAILSGATNETLRIPSAKAADAGAYTVVVANSVGSVSSAPAILSVGKAKQTISFGPLASRRVFDPPFVVGATANSGLPVQLRVVSGPATVSGNLVTVSVAGTIVIRASQLGNAEYEPAPDVEQSFRVIDPAPQIQVQPKSQIVGKGAMVQFTVEASGTTPLNYQWQFNGANIAGGTNATLVLPNVQRTDAGSYAVVVSNSAGSSNSTIALLTVDVPPEPMAQTGGSCENTSDPDLVTGAAFATVHPIGAKPYGCIVVDSGDNHPVLTGRKSFRFEVDPGDCSGNSGFNDCTNDRSRHEVGELFPSGQGETVIYEESIFIPRQKLRPNGRNIMFIGQITASNPSLFSTLCFLEIDDQNRLVLRTQVDFTSTIKAQTLLAADIFDRWIKIITEVVYTTGNDGRLVVTVDGVERFRETRATLPSADARGTWRLGIYNAFVSLATEPYPKQVVYYDRVTKTVTPTATPTMVPLRVINRFDDSSEAGQWRFDFGQATRSTAFDPSVDANGNTASGSLKITIGFNTALGTENKAAFTRNLSPAIDGSNIRSLEMDVLVDPSSARTPTGVSANTSMVVRNGPALSYNPQVYRDLSSNSGWVHITTPLSGAVDSIRALTWHVWGASPQNITGTVTLWIDNVVFREKMSITAQPANQAVTAGQTATFLVIAAADSPVTYQWQFNGVNLPGATSSTLTLPNVQSTAAGSYRVVVSTTAGSVTSTAAMLTVNTPPSISIQPQSQTINSGGTVTFIVAAAGTAPLSFQWQLNGVNIPAAIGPSLTLNNVQPADAGSYLVVVSNSVGSVNSLAATLTVNVPLSIVPQPESQAVHAGTNVTFSVSATGTGPLSYQWQKDRMPISGATDSTLTLTNAQPSDAGNYAVLVSNPSESVTSAAATLMVNVPPLISTQPQTQTAVVGASASFTVTASGTEPLARQWRRNGADLLGATNATLTLNNVRVADAGDYTVVVTNIVGSVTSAPATLSVTKASQLIVFDSLVAKTLGDLPFPVQATANSGLTVTFSIVAGPAVVEGNMVRVTGAGTVTIRASQLGDENYSAAAAVDQSFDVAKASQTLAFGPLSDRPLRDATFAVDAAATSGLPIVFSIVSGPARITGNTITLAGIGTVVVRASQPGDENWKPALEVDQAFRVLGGVVSIKYSAQDGFSLIFDGEISRIYVLEVSEDLAAWTVLEERVNATGQLEFADSKATTPATRFYRVRAKP